MTLISTERFDEQILIPLMLIIKACMVHGDLQSVDLHWSMLLHALAVIRGQGRTLPPLCCSFIKIHHNCLSLVPARQPLLETDIRVHQKPTLGPAIAEEYHVKLPLGFWQVIRRNQLSLSTIESLHRVHSHITGGSIPADYQRRQPYQDLDVICPPLSRQTSFDSLLKVALVILTMMVCYPNNSGSYTYIAIHRRRSDLTKIIPTFTADSLSEQRCLLWIWLLIVVSWSVGTLGVQGPGKKLLKIFQAKHPQLANKRTVRQLSQEFFCIETFLEGFEDVWPALPGGDGGGCPSRKATYWWQQLDPVG